MKLVIAIEVDELDRMPNHRELADITERINHIVAFRFKDKPISFDLAIMESFSGGEWAEE